MSRLRRRAARGSARSRRTPVRAAGGRGLRIPWIPVAIVAGVAVVIGLVGYLIYQAGQPAGNKFEEAARIEEDPAPDLPGEFVNLPEIYAEDGQPAHYGDDKNNTNAHVSREVDYSVQGLPPTGGDHWGSGACGTVPAEAAPFCGPVPAGVYREPWPAGALVHNMEHAGVVIWYNTDDQAVIDDLEDLAADNRDKNLVLTPYPDMEDDTVAVTSWGRRLKVPTSEYNRDDFEEFINKLYCRFDPEGLC